AGLVIEAKEVLFDQPGRDDDGLCIGAIEEEQVIAQILLAFVAMDAAPAGSGIGHDNSFADLPTLRFGVHFGDGPGEFVAKNRRGNDHPRVVSPAKDFQVRSAGQGRFNSNADLTGSQGREIELFNTNMLFAMENSCSHQRLAAAWAPAAVLT